jgi:hypothetical protein
MLSESSIRGGTDGLDSKNLTCSRTDFTTAAGKTLRAQEVPPTVEHAGAVMIPANRRLLYSTFICTLFAWTNSTDCFFENPILSQLQIKRKLIKCKRIQYASHYTVRSESVSQSYSSFLSLHSLRTRIIVHRPSLIALVDRRSFCSFLFFLASSWSSTSATDAVTHRKRKSKKKWPEPTRACVAQATYKETMRTCRGIARGCYRACNRSLLVADIGFAERLSNN